mmetsp:Transcript_9063/g.26435  ORF Transcript_9063/g.26435 Transcript_9063/m.26435 type:complete len:221 (+) Transcript_9063:171-833(+)
MQPRDGAREAWPQPLRPHPLEQPQRLIRLPSSLARGESRSVAVCVRRVARRRHPLRHLAEQPQRRPPLAAARAGGDGGVVADSVGRRAGRGLHLGQQEEGLVRLAAALARRERRVQRDGVGLDALVARVLQHRRGDRPVRWRRARTHHRVVVHEAWPRHSRDRAEIQPRASRDTAETQSRCSREMERARPGRSPSDRIRSSSLSASSGCPPLSHAERAAP